MESVYAVCAALGGTVMLCQFVLTFVGLGGEVADDIGDDPGTADAGDAGESSWFFGVVSFRTVVAAVTFFGLGGLGASYSQVPPKGTFGIALASGAGAMYAVACIMRGLYKLRAEGTVRIERAVGKPGTVYLSIPAQKGGAGKVTLHLQNRTVEYRAITSYENELPTGSSVVVVGVAGPGTVEVAPA